MQIHREVHFLNYFSENLNLQPVHKIKHLNRVHFGHLGFFAIIQRKNLNFVDNYLLFYLALSLTYS